jgi:hypothetical protein
MPRELSSSEEREYDGYRTLGAVEDVRARLGKLTRVQSDFKELKTRADALEKENGELKAKVPDGAVVLTGDEAKAYEAIQAAGGLKEANKRLEGFEELKAKDAKRTREDALAEAAEAEGWNAKTAVKALTRDAEFGGLPFEVKEVEREVQANGKPEKRTVKAGFVTVNDKSIPLGEWVQKNADHILPSLTATQTTQQDGGGREYIEQRGRSSGDGKAADAKTRAKEANAQAASRPNALRPASTNA